jgi:hypothetical protein
MSDYTEAKTQFIRDRIKETAFHERQYIGRLLWLEDIIYRGGPAHQWAENMAYHAMTHDYPLEAEAITRELQEGNLTTTEEFRALQEKRRRELGIEREGWRLFEEKRESEELQQWLGAGGLPDGGNRRDLPEQ